MQFDSVYDWSHNTEQINLNITDHSYKHIFANDDDISNWCELSPVHTAYFSIFIDSSDRNQKLQVANAFRNQGESERHISLGAMESIESSMCVIHSTDTL